MTIFLASRAILARRVKDVWLANGLALAAVCVSYPNLQHQMEVTLTLPLLLLFLAMLDRPPENIDARRWAGAGIMASLMVLSRLDSMLLVILLGLAALADSEYRRAMTSAKLLAFLAGFLPLITGYLISNEIYFHRLMPISGAAKQLRTTHGFQWASLTEYRGTFFCIIAFALILAALVVFRKRLAKEDRILYAAALAFPIAHWLTQVWLSDWRIWPWYTYSLRSAMLVVFLLAGTFLTRMRPPRVQRFAGIFVFTIFLLVAVTRHFKPNGVMGDIYRASQGISDFAKTHPGRYAMGDRAGMMAFLSGQSTIQTEGLMMDNAFLAHIRRQEPLRDVLKEYNIDYYVTFSERLTPEWKPVDLCYEAREPAQGGPGSPQLRGEFCDPVWRLLQHSGETMIFDLRVEHQGG